MQVSYHVLSYTKGATFLNCRKNEVYLHPCSVRVGFQWKNTGHFLEQKQNANELCTIKIGVVFPAGVRSAARNGWNDSKAPSSLADTPRFAMALV